MSAALAWSGRFSEWNRLRVAENKDLGPGGVDFEVVRRRVARTIVRVVHGRLSAHEDREDVIQNVFLQVFVRLDELRNPDCLEMWAARIALNMVHAHIRRRIRNHARRDASVPEGRHDEDWDAKLLAARALSVIGKLPPGERDLFCRSRFSSNGMAGAGEQRRLLRSHDQTPREARAEALRATGLERSQPIEARSRPPGE